ncbi:Sir2 family NAD-dependent protein deacetylase, partial [Nocardia sp. NPDC004722]
DVNANLPTTDAFAAATRLVRPEDVADSIPCGGLLKPDIVYFGESVPKPRVAAAYDLVDSSEALLVVGSSLTVMSGLRFARHTAKSQRPLLILNQGPTRADPLSTLTLDTPCTPVLTALADTLAPM